VSDSTTDTVEPGTYDTYNHYRQDEPLETESDSYYESTGTTGPDTYNNYQQDESPESADDQYGDAPETSSYYDDDYDYEETLDETKARIASQDDQPSPKDQNEAAPGSTSQPELATAVDNRGFVQDNDVPASQETLQPASDSRQHPGQSSPADGPHPPGNEQGSEPEASGVQPPDAASGGTDAGLKQDEEPGAPARQDNQAPGNGQPDGDATESIVESAPPGQTTEGQASKASPDLLNRDTVLSGDRPQGPEGTAGPAGSHQAADSGTVREDSGPAATDEQQDQPDSAAPHRPDSASETDDRIKALLVELDQTRAERDQATAERDQATAERDYTKGVLSETQAELDHAKAELDQASQEIADLNAKGAEQSAPSEEAERPPGRRPDAADGSQPDRSAERPGVLEDEGEKSPTIADRKATDQVSDANDTKSGKARLRHVVSADNLAIGAALIDAQDLAQKIATHAMHDGVSPLAAVLTGLLGVGVSKYWEHKKENK
jgi:hypothetical protein